MNGGSPPTAPKARAGLLTPPGISRFARANAARLRSRFMRVVESLLIGGSRRFQFTQLLLGLPGDVGELGDRVAPVEIDEVAGDLLLRPFLRRVRAGRHAL